MKSLILLVLIGPLVAFADTSNYEKEYEYLNLLSRAEAGEDVSDVFRKNPNYGSIQIIYPLRFQSNLDIGHDFSVRDTYIHLQHYRTIIRVLKAVGHLTLNIEIDKQNIFSVLNENVTDHIVEYCSDTLESLDLTFESKHQNFFERVVKPFKKVETLSLWGGFETLDSPTHTFPELFPVVQHLQFRFANIQDNNALDHKFDYLKKLTLVFEKSLSGPNAEENFRKLIKKNPHATQLELIYSNNDFVRFVSKNLRQLNQVKLRWSDKSINNSAIIVHFDNVKFLTIDSSDFDYNFRKLPILPPEEIFFTNIEGLVVDSFAKSYKAWTQYVAKSVNLRRLQINRHALNDTALAELNSIGANLADFVTDLTNKVADETMLEFVKSHPSLMKVHWRRNKTFHSAALLLESEIGKQWDINEIKNDGNQSNLSELILTRKP